MARVQLIQAAFLLLLSPLSCSPFLVSSSLSSTTSTSSSSRLRAETAAVAEETSSSASAEPIPVTILSGFLGSGKTTLLQNILQNKQGLRVGVIVNDVASVNIDSKLVASSRSNMAAGGTFADGMVELQNGCACCSLSDELLTSVSELVTLSDLRADDDQFHHIVIELSGVADPRQVRSKFQEAQLDQMPLMERVRLDTMVTLVDSSMFRIHFESDKVTSRKSTPELYFRPGEEPDPNDPTSGIPGLEPEMIEGMPPQLLEAVLGSLGKSNGDEEDPVADLLVSQAETADVVVLNKVDLVEKNDPGELDDLAATIQALNPRATLLKTSFGNVPISSILGVAKARGVVLAGVVDDHRDAVEAALGISTKSRDATMEVSTGECADPECTDPSHSHSHSHDHVTSSAADDECSDPVCTDTSHSHSHEHASPAPEHTSISHSHSHGHASPLDATCTDPECTDTSHSHTHSHDHTGIGTFVYRARRPFHPGRLVSFLQRLPVVRGVPEIDFGDEALPIPMEAELALQRTLRSKGFVWCANSHTSAMYWSHAGKSFELACLGQWWATLPREQWPKSAVAYVLNDFDDEGHVEEDGDDSILSVGDRRQEIVFIGKGFVDASSRTFICDALDLCLLSDDEYERYRSMRGNENALAGTFVNLIESRVVSY